MAFIFLDESGGFKKNHSTSYFIIGSYTVGDFKRVSKQFKSWQARKFPKKMRHQPEIKFSEVNIDDNLRLKTLKFISELDVRIRFAYLKRNNIPEEYNPGRHLRSGHLYTQIVGKLIENYFPLNDNELRIFCDKRNLKGISEAQFKEILKTGLLPSLPSKVLIQIEMIDSASSPNIQIADWVTGALAHYLERKPNGKKYYDILQNNIIGDGIEIFKDYWVKKHNHTNSK